MKLLTEEEIRTKFGEYLMKYHWLDEEDVKIATYDFPDTYRNPYLITEYECETIIDGKKYEVYSCHTDFCMFETFDNSVKPFKFNIYYYFEDEKSGARLVKEYMEAPKMYELKTKI